MEPEESKRPVDRLFTMLLVKYGTRFMNQWAPGTMEAVKNDWEQELGGMSWGAVKYAFENLPSDHPPATAAAFRKLALNRPQYFKALTDDRKADPEKVKQIMGGLKVAAQYDKQQWAKTLRGREEAGEKLTPTQKQAWRQALGEPRWRAGLNDQTENVS